MDIVSSDDHDDIDDLDEDQDITSEHVTLTEELQENQEKAVKVKEHKRYMHSSSIFSRKFKKSFCFLDAIKLKMIF